MQKRLLIALLLLSNFACFGQVEYPYLRIVGIMDETLKSAIPEVRSSANDTFFTLFIKTRSFINNTCLPLKHTVIDRNNPSGTLKESIGDTTTYLNGKVKSRTYLSENKPSFKVTFSPNSNGKIDTSYEERLNTSGILVPSNVRRILYRNRFGFDSLYVSQILQNGVWKFSDDYHDFFYDNAGRITQAKYGAYYYLDSLRNVYQRNQTHDYFYTGSNLTLRVDTVAGSVSASGSTIDRIIKTSYKYDALNRVTERQRDIWTPTNPINTFTPEQLTKVISFNAQNKEAETVYSSWSNNAWIDNYKSVFTYTNNNFDILEFVYTNINSAWVLTSKYATKYCGFVNASQDLTPLAVKIYPNPAQDFLILDIDNNNISKANIHVFDSKGTHVFQKDEAIFPYSFNVSNYPNGFYFIKISSGEGQTVTRKVVIMR